MKSFYIIKRYLPFVLGLVSGLVFFIIPILGFDFNYFPGDLGDGRFNMYLLEHAHRYFTGEISDYWNANFMYPDKEVISYSDNLLGTAPIYSFFRLLGLERMYAYQWWVLILMLLNYVCAYLFLKDLFKNNYAAVIGAFVFAFSIAVQSQMTHVQTFPRFPVPLALWMGLKFNENLQPKYFFLAVLFLVYQFYCGIYLGFMLFIPLFTLLLTILIKRGWFTLDKFKNIKWSGAIAGSVIFNLFILLLLMQPYIRRMEISEYRTFSMISATLPTIRSYFFSVDSSYLWQWLSHHSTEMKFFWDHQIFPGIIALLSTAFCVVFAAFKKNKFFRYDFAEKIILISIAAFITFLFFTRFQGFSFYKYLFHMPGFSSMRALTRIININLIFFAIATSFTAFLIMKAFRNYSFTLFVFLLSMVAFDNYARPSKTYRTEVSVSQKRTNELMAKMSHIPEGSIVSYEPPTSVIKDDVASFLNIDAMLAAQSLNLKVVNGYSGACHANFGQFWEKMQKENRESWFKAVSFDSDTVYSIH